MPKFCCTISGIVCSVVLFKILDNSFNFGAVYISQNFNISAYIGAYFSMYCFFNLMSRYCEVQHSKAKQRVWIILCFNLNIERKYCKFMKKYEYWANSWKNIYRKREESQDSLQW